MRGYRHDTSMPAINTDLVVRASASGGQAGSPRRMGGFRDHRIDVNL